MDSRAPSLDRQRRALFLLFSLPGFAISSWVTRTPAIRDELGVSTAQMGLILFAASVGSMCGILTSGRLVTTFGVRIVAVRGLAAVLASMPIVSLGASTGQAWVVALGLLTFGAGMGFAEVAINTEAASLERLTGKLTLPPLHGCFSLGTVVGSIIGTICNQMAVPPAGHLGLIDLALAPIFLHEVAHLGRSSAQAPAEPHTVAGTGHRPPWRDPRLMLIGVIVLAMALAEGTATDWLPLVMVDGHGFSPTLGALVFTVFAIAMSAGRFAGVPFLRRLGRVRVMHISGIAASVGIAAVALVDDQVLAASAVVLWGLGIALGFPIAMSAAADSGPNPAARVSFAASLGYLAFLVGPPALGFFGQTFGLRAALLLPLALVVVAVASAPALSPIRRSAPVLDGEVLRPA